MRICRLHHRNWFPRVIVSPTLSVGRDAIDLPLQWRERTHVLVSPEPGPDLFTLPEDVISNVFDVMNRASRHEFHLATRHVERALELSPRLQWTPNIWMGAIVDGHQAIDRLDVLRELPANVRFAHVLPNEGVPAFDVDGLNFVIVEARGELAGVAALEGACANAGARLFLGPNASDAELRTNASSSLAASTDRRTR